MPAHSRLVIWRHGQTTWNIENRFQGHADVPLNDIGIQQAREAASLLAALKPTAIISSDLMRAYDTAQELGKLTGVEVVKDQGLRETDIGEWSGRTISEIKLADPERYGDWVEGLDVSAGGAENRTQVADRMEAVISRAFSDLPQESLLVVVTHGGSARAAIGRLLGLSVEEWPIIGGLSNCSWSLLEQVLSRGGPRWRLAEHNAGSLPTPVMGDDPGPNTAW
jgi:glucosyl-3-phosphoglycerate phosphatase